MRYPSLKSEGNLIRKFIGYIRAWHVSLFPIQNNYEMCCDPVCACILQKSTLSSCSQKNRKEISYFIKLIFL